MSGIAPRRHRKRFLEEMFWSILTDLIIFYWGIWYAIPDFCGVSLMNPRKNMGHPLFGHPKVACSYYICHGRYVTFASITAQSVHRLLRCQPSKLAIFYENQQMFTFVSPIPYQTSRIYKKSHWRLLRAFSIALATFRNLLAGLRNFSNFLSLLNKVIEEYVDSLYCIGEISWSSGSLATSCSPRLQFIRVFLLEFLLSFVLMNFFSNLHTVDLSKILPILFSGILEQVSF